MKVQDNKYLPKEISWLAFNERVLQEGCDPTVPLIERLKFLGIYSSNIDEFFKVRVATLKRLIKLGKNAINVIGHDPGKVLKKVRKIVVKQHKKFDKIFENTIQELAENKIHFVNEEQLDLRQEKFIREYFETKVRNELSPTIISKNYPLPELEGGQIYLAIIMKHSRKKHKKRYALLEVPTNKLSRFIVLPKRRNGHYVIFLDDVIRFSMKEIFHFFPYDKFEAFTIKISRDAELDLNDDLAESYVQKMSKSLHKRLTASPVRFVYDGNIPKDFLQTILSKLKISDEDALIEGGRYHNRSDFIRFPNMGSAAINRKNIQPILLNRFKTDGRLTDIILQKDLLLHVPYNPFSFFMTFLREVAVDPKVKSIQITLYRLGKVSNIVSALRNALRNGKQVTVVLELQARFDEEANIHWGDVLKNAGAKVIFGVPGLKVHSKLCLVTRKSEKQLRQIAVLGTGNFNEDTAGVYEDLFLFTAKKEITKEVEDIFTFFKKNFVHSTFRHLLVSPFNYRKFITDLINNEIVNAKKGLKAKIILKINHLGDHNIIDKLADASANGVEVIAIVRTMYCALSTDQKLYENINAFGIVDGFLEHSRFMIFQNGDEPKYFLGSGDLLPKNFDTRVEVFTPVYDQHLKNYLNKLINIYLSDNCKARTWEITLSNAVRNNNSKKKFMAQTEIYNYLKVLNG